LPANGVIHISLGSGGDLPEGFPGGRIHDVEGALPAASTPVAVDEQAKIFIHQTRSLAWL
jgi:cell shape-determining protein MreC